MKTARLISIVLLLPLLARAKSDEAIDEEFSHLNGRWNVVEIETNGEKAKVAGWQWTINGPYSRWQLDREKTVVGEPAINLNDPHELEFTPTGESGSMKNRIEGIYKLEGDKLTVCLNKPGGGTPKQFKTKSGDGLCVYVLNRAHATTTQTSK